MIANTFRIAIGLMFACTAAAFAQGVEPTAATSSTTAVEPPAPAGLLARYRFDGDAKDSTKQNFKFRIQYTQFIDNALHLYDGVPEDGNIAGSRAYKASCEIPAMDFRHFTVALRIKPESFWFHTRTILSGGIWSRWFVISYENDLLAITFNNHSLRLNAKAKLELGKWSVLACAVDLPARTVALAVNGGKPEILSLPVDFALDVLKTESASWEKMFLFTDHSCAATFHGYVDEFLVYGRALDATELARVPLAPPDAQTHASDF